MELRLIEIVFDHSNTEKVREVVQPHHATATWSMKLDEELCVVRVIVPAGKVEPITDELAKTLSTDKAFKAAIFAVEALIPTPPEPDKDTEASEGKIADQKKNLKATRSRISREELYADIEPGTRLSGLYLLTTFLSALVAAVGLIRSDVAVVIGAMVIAPLLKPNMALALAATLGDSKLVWEAFRTNLGGAAVVLLTAYVIGFVIPFNPETEQIASRTATDLGDVVLAAAAGTAGALAFTSGVPAALIGVMVAVALLPPLVCVGLLLAAHEGTMAAGAFCLLLVNLTCVNLCAVGTFLAQGIRPMEWWEADKAKKATRMAVFFWGTILALLIAVMLLEPRIGR